MTTDMHDTPSKRQRFILILAERAKEKGVTVAELRDATLHHGRVSGALSTLHRVGKLARLTETRGRCKVYVLPEYVNGRDTEPQGVVHAADKTTLLAADRVEAFLNRYEDDSALFDPPMDPNSDTLNNAMRRLVDYARGRAL